MLIRVHVTWGWGERAHVEVREMAIKVDTKDLDKNMFVMICNPKRVE